MQTSYLDETHWDMFSRLPASALRDSGVRDPETGKLADAAKQEEWRRVRVQRCSREYEAAVARGREGTTANDLSPQQCLVFCAAQDEWREATGRYHWALHPSYQAAQEEGAA